MQTSLTDNWRPDWATFEAQATAMEITFDDPDLDTFLSKVGVVEEQKDCFRIYEYVYSDVLYWGDLFEGEQDDHESIHFKRLLDRPKYVHFDGYYLPQHGPSLRTQKEWTKRFPHLQRVMNVGGYWEYNALSGLYVVIPAEKLSDFPEFEDHTPRILDEPPSE